jgi:hypothetical protein
MGAILANAWLELLLSLIRVAARQGIYQFSGQARKLPRSLRACPINHRH